MKHRIFNTVITLCFLTLISLHANTTVKTDEPHIVSTQNTDNLKIIQENITEPITEYVQKDNKQDMHNEHDTQKIPSLTETTQKENTVDTNSQLSPNHICEKDGNVDDSNEFINIYNTETNAFKNTFSVHFYYDQKELFAEAFWKYITDNQTLKNGCPMLYEFIARYM